MLAAYLDESYGSDAMVVGGLIATVSEWQRLEESWKRILQEEGIPLVGLADVLNGHDRYRSWNREGRERFLSRFVNLIQKHTCRGLASVVAFSDLEAVLSAAPTAIGLGDKLQLAYQLCALGCMAAAHLFATGRPDPRIQVTFESGMKGIGSVQAIAAAIGDDRVLLLPPSDKRSVPALQAADFIASGTHRLASRIERADLPAWSPRGTGRRLVPRTKLEGTWYSRESIKEALSFLRPFARKPEVARAYAAILSSAAGKQGGA